LPGVFADHFKSKVDNIINETDLNETIYNGKQKIIPEKLNFISIDNVRECVNSIKMRNVEGFDRIPQKVLIDGCDHLVGPFTVLFNEIYSKNRF
jgi:hypothetical protein